MVQAGRDLSGRTPLETDNAARGDVNDDRRRTWRIRNRRAVHLGLLCSAGAALGTLQLPHVRNAYHCVAGLMFVGLVLVRLMQRRATLGHMVTQLVRAPTALDKRFRLGGSDTLLFVITLNVLLSGISTAVADRRHSLPLPVPFDRWHLDSGLVLVP